MKNKNVACTSTLTITSCRCIAPYHAWQHTQHSTAHTALLYTVLSTPCYHNLIPDIPYVMQWERLGQQWRRCQRKYSLPPTWLVRACVRDQVCEKKSGAGAHGEPAKARERQGSKSLSPAPSYESFATCSSLLLSSSHSPPPSLLLPLSLSICPSSSFLFPSFLPHPLLNSHNMTQHRVSSHNLIHSMCVLTDNTWLSAEWS